MKLIREINEAVQFKVVTEEAGKPKSYYIEGPFLQAEIKNRNGRFYPMKVLEKETARYIKEMIGGNRAFGELSHPSNPEINLDRVSHIIKSLKREGNDFIGKAKIIDTPHGKIVKNLMDEGATLGVSSRGVGSLTEKEGMNIINDDFRLCTAADIVADPSAPDAFVRGIMEGKEWIWDNGIIREKQINEYKLQIERATRRALQETKVLLFADFMVKLAKNK